MSRGFVGFSALASTTHETRAAYSVSAQENAFRTPRYDTWPDTSVCASLRSGTWPSWLCPLGSDTPLAIHQGSFLPVGILTPEVMTTFHRAASLPQQFDPTTVHCPPLSKFSAPCGVNFNLTRVSLSLEVPTISSAHSFPDRLLSESSQTGFTHQWGLRFTWSDYLCSPVFVCVMWDVNRHMTVHIIITGTILLQND